MPDSPSRVLFLVPALSGGGAERVLVTLLAHLDRARIEPHLALADVSGPLTKDVPEDVVLHDLARGRARKAVFRLPGLLRRVRPRVCFSAFGYMNLLVMLAKPFMPKGIRYVGRETNIPSRNNLRTPYPGLLNFLYPRLYPRFDRVVCQSQDMARDLTENFRLRPEKTTLIHNPVDTARIKAMAHKDCEAPLPGRVNLLAAGKLKHQKGFDLLLRAFARLERPEAHLTILGQGPRKDELSALARELGVEDRVSLPGFAANPWACMARADLFVLSSRFEGFPNVLLEAGACGLPGAAFQCPGGIDEIITDGVNGFLAQPEDPDDLARAMAQGLAANLDRARIQAMTQERFGVERIVARYQDLLLEEAAQATIRP